MVLQAPIGRCYVRSRRMWSSCPPLNHPTSVPIGPPSRPSIPSVSCYVACSSSMKTRPSTCLWFLHGTRLSTLGGIRRHSKGRVQVPHSRRRTSGRSDGLCAFYTRLHVCRRGPCRHQVRKWQMSSTHPRRHDSASLFLGTEYISLTARHELSGASFPHPRATVARIYSRFAGRVVLRDIVLSFDIFC